MKLNHWNAIAVLILGGAVTCCRAEMPNPSSPKPRRIIVFGNQQNDQNPRIPSYIDCQPDRVVLYPGKTAVTWDELQRPENPVTALLDIVQQHMEVAYVVVMVRPGSLKFYRAIRNLINRRPIDVAYEVVDADFKVDWDEPNRALVVVEPAAAAPAAPPWTAPAVRTDEGSVFKPTLRAKVALTPAGQPKEPMFFECRKDMLFYVDMKGLNEQVQKMLNTLDPGQRSGDLSPFLKAIQGKEIGNAYYTVDPKFLLVGRMALVPRPDVKGETVEELKKPNSNFASLLNGPKLDKQAQYVVFMVRDNSFPVFRHARAIAEKAGFDTGWELLGPEEPIQFGSGGTPIAPPGR